MDKKVIYLIFGISLLTLRLLFNYHSELIPGVNGGYYPLQVRILLDTGHLGFSDMPLYFYINLFFVKIASLITTIDTDNIIIHTSKIIDSISLPLLVIPLYLIDKNIFENKLPKFVLLCIVGFVTLSFSPLILTSDLQKNALAIPFMLFSVYHLFSFYCVKSRRHILLSAIFFILTGLTHFGVFSVLALILIISLILFYRRKALLPLLGVSFSVVLIVYLFDPTRVDRLLNAWNVVFEKPAILHGPVSPPDLVNYTLSYLLIGSGIYFLIKQKESFSTYDRNLMLVFLSIIFILSFPLLDIEYAKRFSLLLFIPQAMVLFILFRFFNRILRTTFCTLLILITALSVFLMTGHMKPASITQEAFQDLKNLEQHISEPEKTLIIARHGLEWWTAWQLNTKVGQDKSIDRSTVLKYKNIIKLVQLNGINSMQPNRRGAFHEPFFPTEREPFYVSDYFVATKLEKEDFERMKPPPPPRN